MSLPTRLWGFDDVFFQHTVYVVCGELFWQLVRLCKVRCAQVGHRQRLTNFGTRSYLRVPGAISHGLKIFQQV